MHVADIPQTMASMPATAWIDRRIGERLAAVDRIRPDHQSVRVGWLFVAGRRPLPDGRMQRVLHPLLSAPVRVHRPPVMGDTTLTIAIGRAARHGSGWLAFVNDGDRFIRDLEGFRSKVALLRELTVGRQCPTVANMVYLRLERPDEPKTVRSTTPGMPAAFTGDADALAQHLSGYRDTGLDDALVLFESESVDDLLRQMEAFAERVAPRFASAG
jgi:hypothetical protein